MSYLVVMGVVSLFGALIWHRFVRRPGSQQQRTAKVHPKGKYSGKRRSTSVKPTFHAVTIEHRRRGACDAVRAMEGRIFLSGAAPTLPLEGCAAQTCRCQYVHREDRRDEERRRFHHLEEGYLSSLRMDNRRVTGERRGLGKPRVV